MDEDGEMGEASIGFVISDREVAAKGAYKSLEALPYRRGLAAYRAFESLKAHAKHYSLLDLINEPSSESRNQSMLRKPSDAAEYRKKILIKNSMHLAEESQLEDYRYETHQELKAEKEREDTWMGINKQKQDQPRRLTIEQIRQIPRIKISEKLKKGEKLDIRELDLIFSPEDGSVTIHGDPIDYRSSSYYSYFKSPERYFRVDTKQSSHMELRGLNYLVALDSSKSSHQKLESIKTDLGDGIALVAKLMQSRESLNKPEDLLLCLGVLDYLKSHSTTLFHFLTHEERKFRLPDDENYANLREQSVQMMEKFTRMYYQTLFGLDYDKDLDLEILHSKLDGLVSYAYTSAVQQESHKPDNNKENWRKDWKGIESRVNSRFKYPEAANPPMLALSAQQAAYVYSDAEEIIGIPSGGTELAIVTKLLLEELYQKSIGLSFIAVSTKSHLGRFTGETVSGFVDRLYPNRFKEKKVLMIDDNSASGETLRFINYAMMKQGARQVMAHVADFDPRKLLRINRVEQYTNPEVFKATLGINPIEGENTELLKVWLKNKLNNCKLQVQRYKSQLNREKYQKTSD